MRWGRTLLDGAGEFSLVKDWLKELQVEKEKLQLQLNKLQMQRKRSIVSVEPFGSSQDEVKIYLRFSCVDSNVAEPIVNQMRKSESFTRAVAFFAIPWANEMAYQMGVVEKGSFGGKLIMLIGVPLCMLVGIFISIPVFIQHSILLLLVAYLLIKGLMTTVIKKKYLFE